MQAFIQMYAAKNQFPAGNRDCNGSINLNLNSSKMVNSQSIYLYCWKNLNAWLQYF